MAGTVQRLLFPTMHFSRTCWCPEYSIIAHPYSIPSLQVNCQIVHDQQAALHCLPAPTCAFPALYDKRSHELFRRISSTSGICINSGCNFYASWSVRLPLRKPGTHAGCVFDCARCRGASVRRDAIYDCIDLRQGRCMHSALRW